LERDAHVRAPVRDRGRGARAHALRVRWPGGRRRDAGSLGAPVDLSGTPRARAFRSGASARKPRARRLQPSRDPRVPPGRLGVADVGEGGPVTALAGLTADGHGGLTLGGSRYLLVRPETVVGLQKDVAQALGARAPACIVAGGPAGGARATAGVVGPAPASLHARMAITRVLTDNATRTLNSAQGEMLMISTFVGWTAVRVSSVPLVAALRVAVTAAAVLAWVLERTIIRHANSA